MDVKSIVEIISLIAGTILVTQTIAARQTSDPRAHEVDNVRIMAPRNFLGTPAVQEKIRQAVDRGPYRDYSSWTPGRGGL